MQNTKKHYFGEDGRNKIVLYFKHTIKFGYGLVFPLAYLNYSNTVSSMLCSVAAVKRLPVHQP